MSTDKRRELWEALGRKSQLAIRRRKWRYGKPYRYQPRISLVRRLAEQFGQSEGDIKGRLVELREFIKKYPNYFRV